MARARHMSATVSCVCCEVCPTARADMCPVRTNAVPLLDGPGASTNAPSPWWCVTPAFVSICRLASGHVVFCDCTARHEGPGTHIDVGWFFVTSWSGVLIKLLEMDPGFSKSLLYVLSGTCVNVVLRHVNVHTLRLAQMVWGNMERRNACASMFEAPNVNVITQTQLLLVTRLAPRKHWTTKACSLRMILGACDPDNYCLTNSFRGKHRQTDRQTYRERRSRLLAWFCC